MSAGPASVRASRVLVLSAHCMLLDRRIVSEVNSLAAAGREVTLLSVPATIPEGSLDERVRLILAGGDSAPKQGGLGRLKRRVAQLPKPVSALARGLWSLRPRRRYPSWEGLFDQLAPHERFDVIHCHDLDTLPSAVHLRDTRYPGARIVYDSHELYPFQYHDRRAEAYWLELESRLIGKADLVITVNESFARILAEQHGVRTPEVIYNSYDAAGGAESVDEGAFCRHFGVESSSRLKVLFQGSLTPDRNLESLLRAFAHVADGVELFVLGWGPLEAELRALARRERLSRVHFGEAVPQTRLLGFTRRCDLGVIPYLGDDLLNNRYCTPNKLFEFLAAEVPVCASDLPELERFVVSEGVGRVYPMRDARQIAAAIDDCAAACRGGEFSAEIRARARAKYDWEHQGRKLLELYEGLGV